ncbi:hypothetical protein DFH28DRAFT_947704 [Melampsora americana]|nr:hypothetical protein DFH28DRAFT_947704 [Melampsora americana]
MARINGFRRLWLQPFYVLNAIASTAPTVLLLCHVQRTEALTIAVPLSLMPLMVIGRLGAIRHRMRLNEVCEETIAEIVCDHLWLSSAFQLVRVGNWWWFMIYLGVWILLRKLVEKPKYGGSSKIKTLVPSIFTREVMGRTLESLEGLSPGELLTLDENKLRERMKLNEASYSRVIDQEKHWIVLPVWNRCTRRRSGWKDIEALVAKVSMNYSSERLEFVILDLNGSETLDCELELGLAAPRKPSSSPWVLLRFSQGKEIRRLPARPADDDDDDESDDDMTKLDRGARPEQKAICWSEELIAEFALDFSASCSQTSIDSVKKY